MPPPAQVAEPGVVLAAAGDLPLARFGDRWYLAAVSGVARVLCHQAESSEAKDAKSFHHRRTYHDGAVRIKIS